VVKKLTSGVAQLLKGNGVQIVKGEAFFESANRIQVKDGESIEFSQAIIATGSHTIQIPGFSLKDKEVTDSKGALEFTEAPKRMVVIGGGVIGMELGMLYQKFGTEITVLEASPQILNGIDPDVSQLLQRICKKRKIQIYLSTKASGYEKKKDGLHVTIETPKGKETIICDQVLLSVGRAPNGKNLGLEEIGVKVDPKGFIPVNQKQQTNVSHIFAIGDVVGQPQLAHKASKEGIVAAEVIAGINTEYDVRAMPGAIFTDPEIATVGKTEEEAKKEGFQTFSGKFQMGALGRAISTEATDGFIKVVGDQKTHQILGVHMIGASSSDMISEASLAIEMGARVEDLALTVHPHPTYSEALMEAAEGALGHAIHMLNRKESHA
jgi:dihydrolipoamide dehydrogenase